MSGTSSYPSWHPVQSPILFFKTRVPSDWELSNLPIIELTAPIWNPSTFTMPANLSILSSHRTVHMLASTLSESASLLGNKSTSLDPRLVYSLYASAITIPSPTTGTDVASRLSAYDFPSEMPVSIAATVTGERHSSVTSENLARKWNIGIDTAKKTLQVTTQRGVRTVIHPLHRRYRVDHLHLNRRRLNGDWFSDTLFSKVISLQGNLCAQVFTNDNFTTIHPLSSKSKVSQALTEFSDDVGIPDTIRRWRVLHVTNSVHCTVFLKSSTVCNFFSLYYEELYVTSLVP
jgi:hypothetical protein